ncbi:MAG TPA: alpha/beta hydrolase-fold protein [Rugosimonospora sp.]|nr:alpha/beta hydrolase-fold protein [Rugosimonospora sp.]
MEPNSLSADLAAIAACVVLAVVTAWAWNRGRPVVTWPVRIVSLLGCLLATTAVAGITVNMKLNIYTSWSSLLGSETKPVATAPNKVISTGEGGSRVVAFTVVGRASGITVSAYAYLPPGYDAPAHQHTLYPVVEAVDGFPGSPHTWLVSLNAAGILDKEILSGRMAPTVVVFPYQYTNPAHDGECVNALGGQQWETFLTRDVRAATASEFRVRTDRAGWGIVGTSTGGFCAVNLALRNSAMYAATASLSGYFWALIDHTTGALYKNNAQLRMLNSPLWRITHLPIPDMPVYIAAAKDDKDALDNLNKFVAAAKPPLQVTTVLVPQGGHTGGVWVVLEPATFDWLSGWLAAPSEEKGPNA